MGFRHLLTIGLCSAGLVILLALSIQAQASGGQASASIRATATVVPSLGMTSPEEDAVFLSDAESFGIRDMVRSCSGSGTLAAHQMLVRFPSLTSTVVTVESGSESIDRFSLAEWSQEHQPRSSGALSSPGAMIVDLADACGQLSDDCECVVVTLIYTEN